MPHCGVPIVLENIKYVTKVIPQKTLDYVENLNLIKPNYVIMSFPWQTTRAEVWSPKFQRWHNETINKLGKRRLEDEESRVVEYFHTAAAYMRWYKNLDAIKWLCYQFGAKLYAVEEEHTNQRIIDLTSKYRVQLHEHDWARDLVHAGFETHEHNSEIMSEIMEIHFGDDNEI